MANTWNTITYNNCERFAKSKFEVNSFYCFFNHRYEQKQQMLVKCKLQIIRQYKYKYMDVNLNFPQQRKKIDQIVHVWI